MIYLELFFSFLQVGLFTMGGGYASMPLIEEQTVTLHHWITPEVFADAMTISEMAPGPIALNASVFIGTQIAGLPGAIVSVLGCVTAPAIIAIFLTYFYYKIRSLQLIQGILKGVRPAIIALVASAGITLLTMSLYKSKIIPADWWNMDYTALIIIVLSLLTLRLWKPKPMYVMFAAGLIYSCIKPLFSL